MACVIDYKIELYINGQLCAKWFHVLVHFEHKASADG